MELRKTNEKWDRLFDQNGQESDSRLESVQFEVRDNEGNGIGNANVSRESAYANVSFPDGSSASVNVNGYGAIEKGVETLKAVMGISGY